MFFQVQKNVYVFFIWKQQKQKEMRQWMKICVLKFQIENVNIDNDNDNDNDDMTRRYGPSQTSVKKRRQRSSVDSFLQCHVDVDEEDDWSDQSWLGRDSF